MSDVSYMEKLALIINKPLTSSEVQQVLSRFNLNEEIQPPVEEGMLEERYLTDKSAGIQIEIQPDGRVGTIFLHAFGKDGFAQFQYQLVGDLKFTSTKADVLNCLGLPSASATLKSPSFDVESWVKYCTESHITHFSFNSKGISLITIMPPDWKPGEN